MIQRKQGKWRICGLDLLNMNCALDIQMTKFPVLGAFHPGKFGNTSAASNILDKFTLYQNNFLLFRSGLEALCDMIKLIFVGYSKGIPDGILTITLFGFCYPFLEVQFTAGIKYIFRTSFIKPYIILPL